MPIPSCENCNLPSQYDYLGKDDQWHYGCTTHWMEHRASKQLGIGHAKHLSKDSKAEPRPDNALAKPELPKPVPQPRQYDAVPQGPRPAKAPKRAKGPQEFENMEAGALDPKFVPRPGSVLARTVTLCERPQGASCEEIQIEIGDGHNALKLMRFANAKNGYGWVRDESGRIRVVR